MHKAAKILDFKRAAEIRDQLKKLREMLKQKYFAYAQYGECFLLKISDFSCRIFIIKDSYIISTNC